MSSKQHRIINCRKPGQNFWDGVLGDFTYRNGSTYNSIGITVVDLDILGFSTNGVGTFNTDFGSPEGVTASAGLYGKISKTGGAQVPEPATIFLLSSGLLGLFGYRKKSENPKIKNIPPPETPTRRYNLWVGVFLCF